MTDERSIFKSKQNQGLLNTADDLYANKYKYYIELYHVPSGETVRFKAFLSQFDDQFQSDFAPEQVFGRMDSIQVYKGTTRQISLSWDVPSASEFEAVENIKKCSKLMNMLYPVYRKTASGQGKILNAPPVFKLKFANLIRNAGGNSMGVGGDAKSSGLFGTISGFSYSPDMNSGFIEVPLDDSGQLGLSALGDDLNLVPQTISLSCQFTVVHTHDLGFEDTSGKPRKINHNYPYGIGNKPDAEVNSSHPTQETGPGKEITSAAEKKLMGNFE